ncbi:uncharacterized protein CDAR_458681 [Caerostris darwini]|uniref:Uncharacterized protein n=1 Tax=Caerostris darwini TaxID=1538125 RepID=A0AAV4WWZ7_9ARAC|nr:uncharacterized protein CDAR_458681 [Caerostris darwini]
MSAKRKEKLEERDELLDFWKDHDIYDLGISTSRMLTRSQTPFLRIKNTPSDIALFTDPTAHEPPGMQHLMVTLKGQHGAIPNTIVTRSSGEYLDINDDLVREVNKYKKYSTKKLSSNGKNGNNNNKKNVNNRKKSKK